MIIVIIVNNLIIVIIVNIVIIVIICFSPTSSQLILPIQLCPPWPTLWSLWCCQNVKYIKISSWRFISRSFPFYFCLAYVSETFLCHSEKGGNQVLNFYWIDPINAIKRYIIKIKVCQEILHAIWTSIFQQGSQPTCLFKIKFRNHISNHISSIPVAQPKGFPCLALFYADASFNGQHMTHHPIYSYYTITFFAINLIITIIVIIMIN